MIKKASLEKKIKSLTTYGKLTKNKERKAKIEREYQDLLYSELLIALVEEDYASVKRLAKAAGVSSTVIDAICSRRESRVTLKSISHVAAMLGYGITFEKLPAPVRKGMRE